MNSAMPLVLVAAIIGVPVLASLVLRVSAVFVFLSIVMGDLLVRYLGADAGLVSGLVVKGNNGPVVAQLVLLFLPLLFTILFLRKTMPKSKVLLHLLPLLASAVMLVAITLPRLPDTLEDQVKVSQAGPYLNNSQGLIVGVTVLMMLFLTWYSYRDGHHGKKHH